jgi:hypothetical protein
MLIASYIFLRPFASGQDLIGIPERRRLPAPMLGESANARVDKEKWPLYSDRMEEWSTEKGGEEWAKLRKI